jgi:hypothetical protein
MLPLQVFPRVASRPPRLLQELESMLVDRLRAADKAVCTSMLLPRERDSRMAANLSLDAHRQVGLHGECTLPVQAPWGSRGQHVTRLLSACPLVCCLKCRCLLPLCKASQPTQTSCHAFRQDCLKRTLPGSAEHVVNSVLLLYAAIVFPVLLPSNSQPLVTAL